MDLQFHLEAFEFMILSDNTKKKKKRATETGHRKFSEGKRVHVGMEASKTNQTRWE